MVRLCRCCRILSHDAHQGMGRVKLLHISTLLRRQGEVHRLGGTLHVVELAGPHHLPPFGKASQGPAQILSAGATLVGDGGVKEIAPQLQSPLDDFPGVASSMVQC